MFANKTHLNAHLASSAHRCLTVICPWCKGRNKTFTRIADLEIHHKSVHPEEHVQKKVFSRQNGFYLAKYPKDYARVVGRITSYGSDEAYQARKAVRAWTEGFEDSKTRAEAWNAGWKEGEQLATRERSVSTDRRVVTKRQDDSKTDTSEKGNKSIEGNNDKDKSGKGEAEGRESNKETREKLRAKDKRHDRGNVDYVREGTIEREVDNRSEQDERSNGEDIETDSITPGKRKRQKSTERESKQSKTDEGDECDFDNYKDDIDLGEEAEDQEKEKQADGKLGQELEDGRKKDESKEDDTDSESGTSSSSSESSMSIHRGLGEGIKERAYRILQKGCMPICPPAKRDWSVASEFELDSGMKLLWPPENWRKLTADQKLMAREYGAMFLEKKTNKQFPVISRRMILDKYQFMSLEGEGKPPEEEGSADKIDAKIRAYNYAYVKAVVKGEIESSRVSLSIIKSIERADRWPDTDKIIELLDKHGLKIRL